MYIPAHFAMTTEQVRTVLTAGSAGDLVTTGPTGLAATYLPMLFDPDAGEAGALIGHVSRVNDQWRTPGVGLFILHGPDDYVDAEWLNTPAATSVPTWNYVTVHVYGELVVHDDPEWMLAAVTKLSAAHGDAAVDGMPAAEVATMLRAIVGVELRISRVDGKAKMSQNKSPQVVAQVIDGLRGTGGGPTADWMAMHSLPRAEAKADLLAGLRDTHRQTP